MKLPPDCVFIFDGYNADYEKGLYGFKYQIITAEKKYQFLESIIFNPVDSNQFSQTRLVGIKNILNSLSLMLGISYWKLFCPRSIQTPYIHLTEKQAYFWNSVYTKGLGEFFYKNEIDFRNLVQFPYSKVDTHTKGKFSFQNSALLLFGGGKDSVVTGELLKENNKEFNLFSVGEYDVHKQVSHIMEKELYILNRTLDPLLFRLKQEKNTFDGHIPMTAIYSLLGVFAASLLENSYVIASCEESSSYGNTKFLNTEINHQWSKSYEFETLFQKYIADYIGVGISYFSMLRPIKEIEVVKLFCTFPQYFNVFSSCNRNFTMRVKNNSKPWCCKCAKCVFVFLLLSAFQNKQIIDQIFEKSIIYDESLLYLYKELLGISGFKPFECVGTPEEARWAFAQICKKNYYADSIIFQKLASELSKSIYRSVTDESLFKVSKTHNIPHIYSDIVSSL